MPDAALHAFLIFISTINGLHVHLHVQVVVFILKSEPILHLKITWGREGRGTEAGEWREGGIILQSYFFENNMSRTCSNRKTGNEIFKICAI